MAKEIKQSVNRIQLVGAVEEINLVETTAKDVELSYGDNKKKGTYQMIGKKDWQNPSITIKVERKNENGEVIKEDIFGANFFNTYDKKLDENGKEVENPRFKAMKTIMEYEKGTRIKLDGSIKTNEYPTEQGEWKIGYPQINAFNCSSSNVGEEDLADGKITGVIRTINEEMKNDDPTGRLNVQLYTFDYNGATSPIDLVVEKDLAEDFEDLYSNGDSCQLEIELLMRQVGSKKKKHDFGRRDSKMVEGYQTLEVSIFGGNAPFEEENEYYVDMETMKQAMKERDITIEQKIKDKKEKANSKNSKAQGLGNRKSTVNTSVEETPF